MQERQPPPDRGARLDWTALPRRVRSEVERWLGSEIVSAVTQPTGFSPEVAARLTTGDGRRVFAKAVGPEPNADAPAFHRREIGIAASLPDSTPSPRLLWSYDEGPLHNRHSRESRPLHNRHSREGGPTHNHHSRESGPTHNRHSRKERPSHNRHSREGGNPGVGSPARKSTHRHHGRVPQRELDEGDGGWVLLLFEDVDGRHPAQPWRPDELDRVVAAMEELAETLTPSPLPASVVGMAGERFLGLRSWRRLRDERPSRLDRVDEWSLRHLDTLVAIEDSVADALAGDTLLNYDVRADNILLTQGRTWFVDWPHACVGAPWLDVVAFAPSVTMQGGPPPEEVVSRHSAYRAADPDAVTAAVAELAGFFTHQAAQPPPPGLPTLRAFQDAQGAIAREWTARRTGLA